MAVFAGCSKPVPSGPVPKFYQSPMHPWIKSDKPGRCTICGMALVPVYEGEAGFDSDLVVLSPATSQVIGVETAPVQRGELKRTLRLAGRIDDNAGRHRFISAHFDGRVDHPFIEQVGEEVREGQPLAQIYSPDLLYVVREYQNAIASKNRTVSDVSARRLIQFGLTAGQLDAISTQSHNQFGVDILSPMTGTVIKRYVNSGQYVKTGDPLFELGDFSKMWVLVTVYESDIPYLHIGQKAEITTPAAPGKIFEGILTLVDPNFDPVSRSTTARIEVPNPLVRTSRGERRELPHRAFAEAVMEVSSGDGLLVPRAAVLNTGARTIVFVQKDRGAFEPRKVSVSAYGDHFAEISSGLAEGEIVATNGNLLMDAESQMKNSGSLSGESPDVPAPQKVPHPSAPESVWDPILRKIAAVGLALSADDLKAYQEAITHIREDFPKLPENAPADLQTTWETLERLRSAATGQQASLPEARAAYFPISEAAVDFALALQSHAMGGGSVEVFACPMTKNAFPGAPAKARWLQTGGALRNPWFGAEMIDCGSKILPEARP